MIPEYLPTLANHVWQSTIVAAASAVLALILRNNSARSVLRMVRRRDEIPHFEEQLGLKLESSTGPADVLVIDHIERPSEN